MLCAPILHPLGGDSFIRANMRLTAWPSSNCEQASFSAASLGSLGSFLYPPSTEFGRYLAGARFSR